MTPLGAFFTALGFIVGGIVFYFEARKSQMATQGVALLAGIGTTAGILGAKLTEFVFAGWPVKVPAASILNPSLGGRALFGGVLIGWLAVWIAKMRLGIKRPTGDLFALALPAGEAVGRIGCYFNGCCYGTPSNLPWSIYQHGAYRHPTQIYSAIVAAGLFCFLLAIRSSVKKPGDLFKFYLLGFGFTRFLIEFLRFRDHTVWGLSSMQWACMDTVIMTAISFWWRNRRNNAAAKTV